MTAGDIPSSESPTEQYVALKQTAKQLARIMTKAVITPVAKQHFETDRGLPVTQVLPDRTEPYHFASHGFEADVIPDKRAVINHAFRGSVISATGFARDPEQFGSLVENAQELWTDTFGRYRRQVNQPEHPGPFPLQNDGFAASFETVVTLYNRLLERNSLELVIEIVRDENYPLLARLFDTNEHDILTPGGTDLSALARIDSVVVTYNDGSLAVLRPETRSPPTRGVIIGHDDTPVGMFAHVTDVSNLDISQTVTHEAIRDAMGFDRELDPWTNIETLHIDPDERIRLQGDLRVERTGDVDGFPDELARNARINEYRELVESTLQSISIDAALVRRRHSDVSLDTLFDVTASPDGAILLDARVADIDLELLGYATILGELDIGPAEQFRDYSDIPYIRDPDAVTWSLAPNSLDSSIGEAQDAVHESLNSLAEKHQEAIETRTRQMATEAEISMDVPRQVNLPVDNHLAFIEDGFAPDVDTEPVPVAVPKSTTLHIVHNEHNTVTVTIDPGVYRFSLLPRGLQPVDDRPQWPEE
jgi:hypothetical protein